MALSVVNDPNSMDIRHLASVDVKFSGFHIGGGIYFSANHFPSPGGTSTAIPQRSLTGEIESHATTEYDYTLPSDTLLWDNYDDETGAVMAGFDMSLQVGDPLAGTGSFYDGPSIPLLITNDPNDLYGSVTVTGYPTAENSLTETSGVMHQDTGTLLPGSYVEQTVGSDTGGYFNVLGAEAVGGMSGGPVYLDFDADGDGSSEVYAIATMSRVGTATLPGPPEETIPLIQATSFSPHYEDLAATIESLSGADARTADDFARMTLLSAQTLGSTLTTVQGEFFHEDIYGGINADMLYGAGGDDLLVGRSGDDYLNGGSGDDILTGGAGSDFYASSSFGNGAADQITDFDAAEDVLDLKQFFSTLDDVITASENQLDGSVLITLPSGQGTVRLDNTTVSQLSSTNVNVICFAAGTLILTARGSVKIEALIPGDLIKCHDGQYKALRAINIRKMGKQELLDRPNLWPIQISAGALNKDIPERDLTVSPQHRIMIDSPITSRMFGSPCLIAAKKLLPFSGVEQLPPREGITYVHLIFETHEIVSANGCWSESFFPGPEAKNSLPQDLWQEYRAIFTNLDDFIPAKQIVTGSKAHKLIERHLKNHKPLQQSDHSCAFS